MDRVKVISRQQNRCHVLAVLWAVSDNALVRCEREMMSACFDPLVNSNRRWEGRRSRDVRAPVNCGFAYQYIRSAPGKTSVTRGKRKDECELIGSPRTTTYTVCVRKRQR